MIDYLVIHVHKFGLIELDLLVYFRPDVLVCHLCRLRV